MLRDSSVRCDQTAEVGVCCGADRLCRVARGYFTAVSQQSMTLWTAAGRCPGGSGSRPLRRQRNGPANRWSAMCMVLLVGSLRELEHLM